MNRPQMPQPKLLLAAAQAAARRTRRGGLLGGATGAAARPDCARNVYRNQPYSERLVYL